MKRHRIMASLLAFTVLAGSAQAQLAYPPPPAPPGAAVVYQPAQLDQMLAPIALYPDPLLTSILTAATYPVEVDAAAQWLRYPGAAALTDGALVSAMAGTGWDPSVQSLVPFPQVLAMLDQQLDWTQALGNAFLAQPQDVMDSIQRLRREALMAGTLVSSPYEAVTDDGTYISIMPAQPQMVSVPVYNPSAVYGTWPYPGYPPDYFGPPPGLAAQYFVGPLGFAVGLGVVDLLWQWGDFDWRDHDVRVDPGRFNRMNAGRPPVAATTWQHDADHRRGAPYLDPTSRARFERPVPGSPDQRRDMRFAAPTPAPAPAQVIRGQPRAAAPAEASRPQPRAAAPAEASRPQPRAAAPAEATRPEPRAAAPAEASRPQPRAAAPAEATRPEPRAAAPAEASRPQPSAPAPAPVQVIRGGPRAEPPAPPPQRAPTPFEAVSRAPQAQAEAQRGQQSRQAPPAPAPQRQAVQQPQRPAAPAPQRSAPPQQQQKQQKQQQQQQQQPGERR